MVSISPGSAPFTKKGPVIGFGEEATRLPCRSNPQASIVAATTVSASDTLSTGSAVPITLWKLTGSKTCRAMGIFPSSSLTCPSLEVGNLQHHRSIPTSLRRGRTSHLQTYDPDRVVVD